MNNKNRFWDLPNVELYNIFKKLNLSLRVLFTKDRPFFVNLVKKKLKSFDIKTEETSHV